MNKCIVIATAVVLVAAGALVCGRFVRQEHASTMTGIQRVGKVNVLYVGVAEVMTLSSRSHKSQMMWLVFGGGSAYNVVLDSDIVSYECKSVYAKDEHETIEGASYDVVYTFKGLKAGESGMTIEERSLPNTLTMRM